MGQHIHLTPGDRAVLESWLKAPNTPQRMAQRAAVIIGSADGQSVRAMASRLRVSQVSICRWRGRFQDEGLAGLQTRHRSGRRPRASAEGEERRIVAATMRKPPVATHWSVRRLARHLGMPRTRVHEAWRKHGLQPHRTDHFKFSTDPEFDTKLADVVGLYLNPPEKAFVLCVDEKSQIQALNRTQPILPLRSGIPARMTHDYKRNGTTSLFAALEVATGKVAGRCFDKHTHEEFIAFLELLNRKHRNLDIHLICDNYGTHKHPKVKEWLALHPRFHLHFTPTSASWLNLIERWFARITDEAIRRGSFNSVRQLERTIHKYLAAWNAEPSIFTWTRSAAEIRRSIRHAKRIYRTGH